MTWRWEHYIKLPNVIIMVVFLAGAGVLKGHLVARTSPIFGCITPPLWLPYNKKHADKKHAALLMAHLPIRAKNSQIYEQDRYVSMYLKKTS